MLVSNQKQKVGIMTIAFISTSDKTITRYAHFDAETPAEAKEITDYYWSEVRNGNIYGFSVI